MEVIHERCAGIDVHKKEVVVCVRIAAGGKVHRELRSFPTNTGDLLRLMDWLTEAGVTHVVMESTGSYWKPVWHVLDGAFELMLANALHVKSVPGRKSDTKDAEWLADLLAHGLLRGSFVPPEPVQELRELMRTRKQLVRERNRHTQRIQKVLEHGNIKLANVVSDILGASGRRILVALINGENNPEKLAALGGVRLRASKAELAAALHGYVTEHHRFLLRLHLDQIMAIDTGIDDVERRVERCIEPFREVADLLDTIPGIDQLTAASILGEIGDDMTRFPTAGHLVSWAGLCRKLDETAGKPRSTRLRRGGLWIKTILLQAAWAAVKRKDSYYRAQFMRLSRRRGAKKAIVAVAASMLTTAYYVIQRREPFRDLGPDHFERRDRQATIRAHIRRLEQLGLHVEVTSIANSAA